MPKKHAVRSYYDQYSIKYDKFYAPIQRQKLDHIIQYVPQAHQMLDLGGGSGLLSSWLRAELINIDLSLKMLRAGTKLGRLFLPIAADLEALPIRSNSFTALISFTAIQNCQDVYQALHEIFRVMMTSGSCILTFLKKVTDRKIIEQYFFDLTVPYRLVQFGGEDYCYIIGRQ